MMFRSEKAATPLVALLVVVPDSLPLAGFSPITTVMEAVEVVSVVSSSRRTVIVGGPGMVSDMVAFVGRVVKASLAAPLTVKELLVAEVREPLVAVSVKPSPDLDIETPLKVATPLLVLTPVVPLSVAPVVPVPEVIARLTVALERVAVLLKASRRMTTGWVVKAAFLVAPAGWVEKARLEADAGFTVNEALVPVADPPENGVAVMVVPLWALVMVTLCGSSTPLLKAAVLPLPEERVALEVITALLLDPLNPVAVLPKASRAVIRREKATPAVWVLMAPPPEASTVKDETLPASSVSVPKFVPLEAPLTDEVPLLVILPLASGVPAVGRTAIPDQVILPGQTVEAVLTVIVMVVEATVAVLEESARSVS